MRGKSASPINVARRRTKVRELMAEIAGELVIEDWQPGFVLAFLKIREMFDLDREGMYDPAYHPSPMEIAERAELERIKAAKDRAKADGECEVGSEGWDFEGPNDEDF